MAMRFEHEDQAILWLSSLPNVDPDFADFQGVDVDWPAAARSILHRCWGGGLVADSAPWRIRDAIASHARLWL